MRRTLTSSLLLAVVVLNPFFYSCSLESWTHGISDAESGDLDQAIGALAAVVSPLASTTIPALAVVGGVQRGSVPAVVKVEFAPRPPRAPPLV